MYKLCWKFKSKVRLFPYFGGAKFKNVLVRDSMLIINEEKLNKHMKTLKEGKYSFKVTEIFPKWLKLKHLGKSRIT